MADPETVKTSALDNPDVAVDPEPAIDYADSAGKIITDMPVAGPGDMPIERQTQTFEGFMSLSRYIGTAIVLVVFWSTIIFGLDGATFWTALSTLGLGLALGAGLKLRGAYYPVLIGAFILMLIFGWMTNAMWLTPDVDSPEEVVVEG